MGMIVQLGAFNSSTSGKAVLRIVLAGSGPYNDQPACAPYIGSPVFNIDLSTTAGQQQQALVELLFATGQSVHMVGTGACALGMGLPNQDNIVPEDVGVAYSQT